MELDDVLFDRIHRYLAGQMTEAERQVFEDNLQIDSSLRQELELQRQIKAGFQVLGYRQTLNTIQNELNQAGLLWQPAESQLAPPPQVQVPTRQKETVLRQMNWIPYAVAASVLLVAIWLFYPQPDPAENPLANKENHPHTTVPSSATLQTPPSASALPPPLASLPKEKQLLASHFDKLVAHYFNPTLRLTPPKPVDDDRLGAGRPQEEATGLDRDTNAIRTGVRLLEKDKIRAAIATLKPATTIDLTDWQANARWFLALAYLKAYQPSLARQQLQILIGDHTNLYTNDAQQLLQRLPH